MASLADAEEVLRSTNAKANFQWLTRLLMCGGLRLLRETFDSIITPADLPVKLSDPAIQAQLAGARLSLPERQCLNPSPGVYGKSTDFDITLIFRLLRTICGLTPPPGPRGWDDLPNSADHSLEADLVRIKCYRNGVHGHKKSMEVSDSEFVRLWKEISEALLRIAARISPAKRDEWKKAIDDFLTNPLTPDEERCIEELDRWYKQDMDVKFEVEQLNEKVTALQDGMTGGNERIMEELRRLEELVTQSQGPVVVNVIVVSVESFTQAGSPVAFHHPPESPLLAQSNGSARSVIIPVQSDHEQAAGTEVTEGSSGELQSQRSHPMWKRIWDAILSTTETLHLLYYYFGYVRNVFVRRHDRGSLLLTVECSSLQVLEGLWEDYRSGHLNAIAQEILVTEEVLEKLGLDEVKLKTFISEEEYEKGKQIIMGHSERVLPEGKPKVGSRAMKESSYDPRPEISSASRTTDSSFEPEITPAAMSEFAMSSQGDLGNTSSVDEIKLGDRIGDGSYAEVFKAVWCGKPVAAKRIRPIFFEGDYDGCIRTAFLEKFKTEWEILRNLQHDNIVRYYTVILPPAPETPIIVTELLECDLAKYIRQSQSTPKVAFTEVVKIMLDVAEALQYLHSQKPPIVHRDLASKNVLLTKTMHAKIADLGLAKAFPRGAMFATAVPGTPVYAAPETYPKKYGGGSFHVKARYTEKVDIFSFGAMMLETIIGHLPERALPDPVLEDGEIVPEYIRRSEDLEEMGPDHPLHNLVCQCFENIPEKRPSAAEIIETLLKFSKEGKASSSLPGEKVGTMPRTHYDHKFKVVVLGESGVGKTSIVARFLDANKEFSEIPVPATILSEDHFERLHFRDKSVHLHLVDMGGHKFTKADSFVPQIFRHVRGAVIVFDLTSEMSFLEVAKWLDVVKERRSQGLALVLVGNKNDEDRWVDARRVEDFARREGMFYIEASAKSRENIDEIFSVLMDLMIEREKQKESSAELSSSLLDSLRLSQETSPIAERYLTPRRHALDHGVVMLEENLEGTMAGDGQDEKKKAWSCLLN